MTTTAMERTGTDADAASATRRRAHVRLLRKIGVAVAGTALIVAGVAMLVLPGPGIVAILAGLGLLGTEFPTARRISTRVNGYARAAWHGIRDGASRLRRRG
ncbi:PGPGW domain-containing protein [Actinomadura sp. NPDC000600]|uniref:PGPGW domain-containing protein n=1 Tax=Actinomadura sp. NPDC000600 TaxID=3154262 RepID=UPI00339818CD